MPSWLLLALFISGGMLVGPALVLMASGRREAMDALSAYAAWYAAMLLVAGIVAGSMLLLGR